MPTPFADYQLFAVYRHQSFPFLAYTFFSETAIQSTDERCRFDGIKPHVRLGAEVHIAISRLTSLRAPPLDRTYALLDQREAFVETGHILLDGKTAVETLRARIS